MINRRKILSRCYKQTFYGQLRVLASFVFLVCCTFVPLPCFSAEPTLVIGTSYKSFLSTPKEDGLLDRIAKEAFARLGIQAEVPFLPAERSLMAANEGLHDGELNRIAGISKMYPNLVQVPESNMDFRFVGFSKDLAIETKDWADLKPYRVGIVKGWKILEQNLKDHPDVIYVYSAEQLFRQLEKGHVDIVLYGELVGRAQLKNMGLTEFNILSPPLAIREMFMYLHKKHTTLVPQLAESLRGMKKDGTYNRIVSETKVLYLGDE